MARKELKLLRESAGMSQTELAKKAGLGITTIQRLEYSPDDLRSIKYKNLYKLASALGVSVCDIEMYDEEQLDNDEFDPISQG